MHVPPAAGEVQASAAPREIRPHAVWQASSGLPTRYGPFTIHVFREGEGETAKEHVAMVFGTVAGGEAVPVRVHSECMTSEVFGSLKCDCREQLEFALAEVARRGAGAVLYLRQEGRGIGLTNKIRAYELQSHGHDTVDANRLLGLPDDAREYHVAREMLEHLQVRSVSLLTNNPDKVHKMTELGITVVERLPVVITPNAFSQGYLDTKRNRMAHYLPEWGLELGSVRTARGGDAE